MIYVQDSGKLINDAGRLLGLGYSGHGDGLNNPDMQDDAGIGPIPCGWYTLGEPRDGAHGPYEVPLVPDAGNKMFGRSGFLMHGDEIAHPGEHRASHGCIIVARVVRTRAVTTKERLHVIAHDYAFS